MTGGSNRQLTLLLGPLLSMGRRRFGNVLVTPNQTDLHLSDVAAAVRYVEEGQARGKVVVTVRH